jgi:hypothetical protein
MATQRIVHMIQKSIDSVRVWISMTNMKVVEFASAVKYCQIILIERLEKNYYNLIVS